MCIRDRIYTYNDHRDNLQDNHAKLLDVADKEGTLPLSMENLNKYYDLLKKIETEPYKNDNRFNLEITVYTEKDSIKVQSLNVERMKETLHFVQGELLENEIVILVF